LSSVPAGIARQTTVARVTVLGSGTSHGVPVIACDCSVCTSTDPRDTRLRPSIYLEVPEHARLLVDMTPDFRQQALRHRLRRIDAVLFTHAHADHILGFDEIRRFNTLQEGAIPAFGNREAWDVLKRSFYYAFDGIPRLGGGVPQVLDREATGPFSVGGVRITPVPVWHGSLPVLGFRFGGFAYVTDCSRIPEESWALLQQLDTLILGALRDEPHPTHFTVAEAVDVVRRLAPRRTFLTHMTHDLGHVATNARLPAGVELAYDGLVLDVPVDVE
jgi:phosphoribosyl 1,2-cyclic phosphate phosphodiesterase